MIPLLLFLLAMAAVYVGTIETAFSALMRLSLRLMAERGGRDDRLGFYLDDPIQLFVPARLLLGLIFSLATVHRDPDRRRRAPVDRDAPAVRRRLHRRLRARAADAHRAAQPGARARDRCCRRSTVAARCPPADRRPRPADCRRAAVPSAPRPRSVNGAPAEPGRRVAHAYLEAGEEQGLIEGDERRLLQSIVDFGDTLVREVMTPRPDIVAIRADTTLDELRALFREQEYSRFPVYKENLDNILGIVFVKDLIR